MRVHKPFSLFFCFSEQPSTARWYEYAPANEHFRIAHFYRDFAEKYLKKIAVSIRKYGLFLKKLRNLHRMTILQYAIFYVPCAL